MTVSSSEPTSSPERGRLIVSSSSSTPESTSPTPLRVAFIGKAGTGKTTHAQLLRARFKGDVLSFASPLKKLTAELFEDRMLDPQFARTANQEVGVLARRLAGADIWVNKLVAKVSRTRNCFVDDCRFMSEYYALKRLGFVLIKLVADERELMRRRPSMTHDQWNHETERDSMFIYADALFLTDGTDGKSKQDVHTEMVEFLKEFLKDFRKS